MSLIDATASPQAIRAEAELEADAGRLSEGDLCGRLLNEGPHGRSTTVGEDLGARADLHVKIERDTVAFADPARDVHDPPRLARVYVRSGGLGLANVTWRVGTLETTFGDLRLYDAHPTRMFDDTLGAQATWAKGGTALDLAVGDAAWSSDGLDDKARPTGGGTLRHAFGGHLDVGGGGQAWLDEGAVGYRLVGSVGVAGLGALVGNRVQVGWTRPSPDPDDPTRTDGRGELVVGDELALAVVPDRLEVSGAAQLTRTTDADAPDTDRTGLSAVGRAQLAVAPGVALLGETAVAREIAAVDAFRVGEGVDSPARDTWQGKAGLVLTPVGSGPSLRVLYGAQYSDEKGAWPGADPGERRHWHHLVGVEAGARL